MNRSLLSLSFSLWLACVCVLLSAQCAVSQFFACKFDGKLGHYDLSPLNGTQIAGDDGMVPPTWVYFLNLCGVANGSAAADCTGLKPAPMVCQVAPSEPIFNTNALAYPTEHTPHVWTEITKPFVGVQLIASGQADPGCIPTGIDSSIIQIKCDPNAPTPPTNLSAPVLEYPLCTYTMQFAHASACPISSTMMSAPTDFSISMSKSTASMSAGSIASLVLAFKQLSGPPQLFKWEASGLPAELSATFEPPVGTGSTQTVLKLEAAASITRGAYSLEVLARTAEAVTSQQLTLTILSSALD